VPHSGPPTIMDVDTKEFWQSEPLTQLYFDEKEGIFLLNYFATIYKDLNMKRDVQ
jgi:hypothetical protein